MKSFLALVAAAFLGGGAALGVGTAIWDEGGTTTVINSPASSDSSLASQTETGSSDAGAVARLGLRDRQGRAHPHEFPRG